MKRTSITSIICLLLGAFAGWQSALANDTLELKPFSAEYVAFRSGTDVGSAKLSLESTTNNQFKLHYESKVSRFFLSDKRFETTLFATDDNQLFPITYNYKRTGTGLNKYLALRFNRDTHTIVIDDEKEIKWQGEFDNQLFRIDIPRKLALGETRFEYDFINYRGEKRQYILEVIATDNLSLPYGQLSAFKVKVDRSSGPRVTYAWFAPSLNYNLVRLQQFKDDKEQGDMQLSKFSYL